VSVQRSVSRLGYSGTLDALGRCWEPGSARAQSSPDVYAVEPGDGENYRRPHFVGLKNLVQILTAAIRSCAQAFRVFGLSVAGVTIPRLQVELRMGDGDGTTFSPSGPFCSRDRNERMEARLVHNRLEEISSGSFGGCEILISGSSTCPPFTFFVDEVLFADPVFIRCCAWHSLTQPGSPRD